MRSAVAFLSLVACHATPPAVRPPSCPPAAPPPAATPPSVSIACELEHGCVVPEAHVSVAYDHDRSAATIEIELVGPADLGPGMPGPVTLPCTGASEVGGVQLCAVQHNPVRCLVKDGSPDCVVFADEVTGYQQARRLVLVARVRGPLPPTLPIHLHLGMCAADGRCTIGHGTATVTLPPAAP